MRQPFPIRPPLGDDIPFVELNPWSRQVPVVQFHLSVSARGDVAGDGEAAVKVAVGM